MSKSLSEPGSANPFQQLMRSLVASAERDRFRYLLVLSGEEDWSCLTAETLLAVSGLQKVLWIGAVEHFDGRQLEPNQALRILGTETDAVVFNAFSGFDVDAFAAVSGTVRGGGLLLLLAPPLKDWPAFNDPENRRITVAPYAAEEVSGRFLQRFAQAVRDTADVALIEQGADLDVHPFVIPDKPVATPPPQETLSDTDCRTTDQQRAVEAIIKVAKGHRRRPVVLSADRGRGKSAALGIAAARLLQRGLKHIVVTGPRIDTVEEIFLHAQRLLPEAIASRARLQLGAAKMLFVAPDELVSSPVDVDLLLVDEAATLPVPILTNLLRRHSRIAFATTVHGYEGTGRGFSLRFARELDTHTRGWKNVELATPIRWAPTDPLERFIFRSLLLAASAIADDAIDTARPDSCIFEWQDRNKLAQDEQCLNELFGLLILAHYRTRPYDLRHLLDGPNLSIGTMRFEGHVVATVVVAREGGFDTQTADEVWAGVTRPHGHLIPESLAVHVGLPAAPELRCLRIMRIAVHPAVQGHGIGSSLLGEVASQAEHEKMDYVGASFGATGPLLRFWLRQGYIPLRVSVKRGASSGAHSVLMCRPLSVKGCDLIDAGRERFHAHFIQQLSDVLQDLEVELVLMLLRSCPSPGVALTAADWRDVASFAYGQRIYEVCVGAIWHLVSAALLDRQCQEVLLVSERAVLVGKVLQKHDWQTAARLADLSGRAETVRVLRQALQKLTVRLGDAEVQQQADKLQTLLRTK